MKSSKFILLAFVLILAGCASPAAQVKPDLAAEVTAPALTQPASPTATPDPTQTQTASPTLTPTVTATPLPTATPAPLTLNFDTVPDFQIIRDSNSPAIAGKRFAQALSPDTGQVAFASCENGKETFCTKSIFRLIDAETGQVVRDLEFLSPVIKLLKFSPDGRYLAAAGCDMNLALYGVSDAVCLKPRAWLVDTASGKMVFEMKGYTSHMASMVFSPDGSKLFTSVLFSRNAGDGDYFIHIYDVPTGKVLAVLNPPIQTDFSMIFTIDLSPDGRYLVTDAGIYGNLYASYVEWWDVSDPGQPRQVATINASYYHTISPDSSQIIIQNPENHSLHRYQLDSGTLIGAVPPPKEAGPRGFELISGFQYVNDANTLLLDYGSQLDIVNTDSGEMIKSIPADYIADHLLSPDRRLLVNSGYKFNGQGLDVAKVFSVWDTSTWQEVPKMAFMSDDFGMAYLYAFNSDQTRMFLVSDFTFNQRIVTWGFPGPAQKDAEKYLLHFFDLLANGSYAQAVAQTRWEQKDFADWLRKNIPGLFDGTDLLAGVQKMCTDPAFPCRPVRDVLYRSEVAPGQYMFMVDFSGPDGKVEPWPSHTNNPAMSLYSNSMFRYVVVQLADGSFSMSDGLPPGMLLYEK